MRQTHPVLSLILVTIFLAACAPTESQGSSPETAPAAPPMVENTTTPGVDLTATRLYTDGLSSSTAAPTAQAVATSRGPNLEATDPTTVSLASGGVQFVEFFRFT